MDTWIVDVDGVLADFNTGFARVLNDLGASPGAPDLIDPTSPGFPSTWNWDLDLAGPVLAKQAWDYVLSSPDWWFSLKPYSGVSEALEKLQTSPWVDVVFATSRKASLKPATQKWLKHNGWYLNPPQVLISSHKEFLAVGLDAKVVIDDKPEYVEAYVKMGIDHVYLIDAPYNQGLREGGYQRVSSFVEIVG